MCCIRFSPNVVLHIIVKIRHFGLVCTKDIVAEVLWFDQVQLCRPTVSCATMFGLERRGFLLATLSNKGFFNCTIIDFNTSHAK